LGNEVRKMVWVEEVILYMCGKCGTLYHDKFQAERCCAGGNVYYTEKDGVVRMREGKRMQEGKKNRGRRSLRGDEGGIGTHLG
jgi:hypothetical protein